MKLVRLVGTVCSILSLAACTSPGKRTAIGAGAGAAVGGIIGHQSGNAGKGAIIGGVLGGAIGNNMDKQAKEMSQVAETKRTEDGGIITNLKGDILFDTGRSTLKPESVTKIDQLADIIKKYPGTTVTVAGHTDSVGSNSMNQELSEQRARAVQAEMLSRGVEKDRLLIMGLGESQPVASNNTLQGRSKNRRVELKVTPAGQQQTIR